MDIKQGDIFRLNIKNKKFEHVVVVSNDLMNEASTGVIAVSLIGENIGLVLPSHVKLTPSENPFDTDFFAMTEQIHTLSKSIFIEKIGRVDEGTLKKIAEGHAFNTFVDGNFFRKVNLSNIKFVKGEEIPFNEDYDNEFKEIWSGKTYEEIKNQIKKTSVEYVCAFLNNGGGRLLFGITDDGIVSGFKLSSKERDQLSQAINNTLRDSIFPKLISTNFRLEFHPVLFRVEEESTYYENLENEYVLEILVLPPLDPSTIYYEGANKLWTKLNGQTRVLENTEITDFIIKKAFSNNKI